MSEVGVALIVMAIGMPVAVLAVAAAFLLMSRQHEKHLIAVVDRFSSRNYQDFAMTDMTRREIAADQQADDGEEATEDEAFDKFLADRQAAAQVLGTMEAVG